MSRYSYSTLKSLKKDYLIEIIRSAERNIEALEERVNNQYSLLLEKCGSCTSCEKDTSTKTFIDEARFLYRVFKKRCDDTKCDNCTLYAEDEIDCFLKYLDEIEGGHK